MVEWKLSFVKGPNGYGLKLTSLFHTVLIPKFMNLPLYSPYIRMA
jgi:hypothetical protein